MNGFLEFLQIPIVQIIGWGLGAIGWMIGISSGYLQWKGYKQQQDDRAPFNYLLEQVQLDWKGKYTEEQVNQLTQQFNQLEKQIREQIPTMAKKVFLDDQKSALENSIGNLFQQYTLTVTELENVGGQAPLPPTIYREIEEKIIPNYFKQRRQQQITYLMIFVILVLMLLPISPVLLLIQFSIPLIEYLNDHEILRNYLVVLTLVSIIPFAFRLDKLKERVLKNKPLFLGLCFAGILVALGILFSLYYAILYTGNLFIDFILLSIPVIVFPISFRVLGMLLASWLSTLSNPMRRYQP